MFKSDILFKRQHVDETIGIILHLFVELLGCPLGAILAFYLLFFTRLWWICALYLIWIYVFDKDTCERGGRSVEWVRNLPIWTYTLQYFSSKLVKVPGVELNAKKNYLFCCFPHGFINTGPPINLAIYTGGVRNVFPYHTTYVCTLKSLISFPFHRDLLYALGLVSASAKSINWLMGDPKGGNIAALMVGGAEEAFYCKPGTYKLVLKKRKGFVKLALRNGSPLVPVFSFGETDIWDQVDYPAGSLMRNCQDWCKNKLGFAPVVPLGRGFIQPSLIPRKAKLTLCDSAWTYISITWYTIVYLMSVQLSLVFGLFLILFTRFWYLVLVYLFWVLIDKDVGDRGGRSWDYYRTTKLMTALVEYFPIKWRKVEGCELKEDKNYFFVGVPHGFVATGFLYPCSVKFLGMFPKHEVYMTVLQKNFKIPFIREALLAIGGISATVEGMKYILGKPGGGNIIAIVPGGADEAFHLQSGCYKVLIKKRRGFVKIALEEGVSLVPCISFGEVEILGQHKGKWILAFQLWFRKVTKFVPIIPKGRGFLQPSYIPFRKPLNLVVGKPIDVEKVEHPTPEQIDTLHKKFIVELEKLFEEEKFKYLENPETTKLEFV